MKGDVTTNGALRPLDRPRRAPPIWRAKCPSLPWGSHGHQKRESFSLDLSAPQRLFSLCSGCLATGSLTEKGRISTCPLVEASPLLLLRPFVSSQLSWLLVEKLRDACEEAEYPIIGKIKSLKCLITNLTSNTASFTLFECAARCRITSYFCVAH